MVDEEIVNKKEELENLVKKKSGNIWRRSFLRKIEKKLRKEKKKDEEKIEDNKMFMGKFLKKMKWIREELKRIGM